MTWTGKPIGRLGKAWLRKSHNASIVINQEENSIRSSTSLPTKGQAPREKDQGNQKVRKTRATEGQRNLTNYPWSIMEEDDTPASENDDPVHVWDNSVCLLERRGIKKEIVEPSYGDIELPVRVRRPPTPQPLCSIRLCPPLS